MSKSGAPEVTVPRAPNLRVAIVAATWHPVVMGGLIAGARRVLLEAGIAEPLVVRVPGTLELPVVAARLARQGHDAVVALGVVIRGGTPHLSTSAGRPPTACRGSRSTPVSRSVLEC